MCSLPNPAAVAQSPLACCHEGGGPLCPTAGSFHPVGGLLCAWKGLVNLLRAIVPWGSGTWAGGSPSPGTLRYRNTQLHIILQTGCKEAGGGVLEMHFYCHCCNNYDSSWQCDSFLLRCSISNLTSTIAVLQGSEGQESKGEGSCTSRMLCLAPVPLCP